MKNKNLDSFKEKANTVLLKDAMLNVSGGFVDAEYCHPPARVGKTRFTAQQIDSFFANPQWNEQFNAMYERGNEQLAEKRMMFFESHVG